jgi:putative ABC transport system substrate-binding protein
MSDEPAMKRKAFLAALSVSLTVAVGCSKRPGPPPSVKTADPYEIVVFQSADSPTGEQVRKGILRALAANGLQEGVDVRLYVRIVEDGLSAVQAAARELAASEVDLVMPLSTACLQACLLADGGKPIVFGAIANPYLAGAGRSAVDHLGYVTGVASTAPVRQTLRFIKEVMPGVRRIGTLWTPAEINSEYYYELVRDAAAELDVQVVAEPVANIHDIPQAAQVLVNEKVDLIFPVSDNTINSALGALGRVAEESGVPFFGAVLQAAGFGASAAMGFDFEEMGYQAGLIAVRVKDGESPGEIPFQYMDEIKVRINLEAAAKQGVRFTEAVLGRAEILAKDVPSSSDAAGLADGPGGEGDPL